jgi:hypothetical protein
MISKSLIVKKPGKSFALRLYKEQTLFYLILLKFYFNIFI